MKNILVVTGSRAEYGIMRNLIKKLNSFSDFNVEIVATAMHLEKKYGYTVKDIENDNFKIVRKIFLDLKDTTKLTLSKALSKLTGELSNVFESKKYDLIIILGDRYEMLPVANVALIYNIPICHIHGGEKTLGNFDEFIRHSITKMSHLHLVSTEEFRKRVIQLGEQEDRVFNIGAMGVENVLNQKFLSKEELENKLNFILEEEYFVVLFHPVTLEENTARNQMENVVKALSTTNKQLIFIGSNADTDSDKIMEVVKNYVDKNENSKLFTSLPTNYYHSLVKYSKGLIGNSSSGLIEIPSLKVPTLNIGNRQLGRVCGKSVVTVSNDFEDILKGIELINKVTDFTNPYEKENSSSIAVEIIRNFLQNSSTIKIFNDLMI